MDRETFAELFRRSSQQARSFAQTFVEEELPAELRFRINFTHEKQLHASERIFPKDDDPSTTGSRWSVDEAHALATLWRDGFIPEWIYLSVVGETGTATIIGATACGRFLADDLLLPYQSVGTGPFHVTGPALPNEYVEGQRFSIHERVEVREADELEWVTQRKPSRVRLLTLSGGAFDDNAVSNLPDLPGVQSLVLSETNVRGPGLSSLVRLTSLKTLRVRQPESTRMDVSYAPALQELTGLWVDPAPAEPWGFGRWVERLPKLDWVYLTSHGQLFVDGRLPKQMTSVTLAGTRLVGNLRLCEQTMSLVLAFPGMSETDLGALLEPVRQVTKHLVLYNTPVGDAFIGRVVQRWALRDLTVRRTNVSAAYIEELCAEYPHLRVVAGRTIYHGRARTETAWVELNQLKPTRS